MLGIVLLRISAAACCTSVGFTGPRSGQQSARSARPAFWPPLQHASLPFFSPPAVRKNAGATCSHSSGRRRWLTAELAAGSANSFIRGWQFLGGCRCSEGCCQGDLSDCRELSAGSSLAATAAHRKFLVTPRATDVELWTVADIRRTWISCTPYSIFRTRERN